MGCSLVGNRVSVIGYRLLDIGYGLSGIGNQELSMNMKRYIVLVVAMMMVAGAWAQNATSSPSSRFGYGELNSNLPNAYRAMGGVGVGMRSNKAINPAQPASYTACDSMTFMFDICFQWHLNA